MTGACLQRIEREVLEGLREKLKDIDYYLDNYEKEIIKEVANKQKSIVKIKNKIESLKKERKNLIRKQNQEENAIPHEDYIEIKGDIEVELNELLTQLEEFENDDDNNTLIKYKKAVPILEECLKKYDEMSIPQKNEALKSIIERITYSKTKRLNWRKNEEDDLHLHIELKL